MARIFEMMKDLMFGEYEDDEDDFDEEYEEEQPYVSENTFHNRDSIRDIRDREYREPIRENRDREREVRDFEPTPLRRNQTQSASARTNPQVVGGGRSSGTRNGNPQIYSINTQVQMQVVIIKPEVYEDAQEICNQVKAKKPVVVNLEKVEFPLAQRIMDFLSGTCYSLDGSIQRVANNIFIIAPENVEISGDFKEELKTKGFNLPWANSGR